MSAYWLMDSGGLTLGPISLEVLRELAREGRVSGFSQASRDGRTFLHLSAFPEVADALIPPSLIERRTREAQQAERIQRDLERFRRLSPNELFGVAKGAALSGMRDAYRVRATPYNPAALTAGASPALIRAC